VPNVSAESQQEVPIEQNVEQKDVDAAVSAVVGEVMLDGAVVGEVMLDGAVVGEVMLDDGAPNTKRRRTNAEGSEEACLPAENTTASSLYVKVNPASESASAASTPTTVLATSATSVAALQSHSCDSDGGSDKDTCADRESEGAEAVHGKDVVSKANGVTSSSVLAETDSQLTSVLHVLEQLRNTLPLVLENGSQEFHNSIPRFRLVHAFYRALLLRQQVPRCILCCITFLSCLKKDEVNTHTLQSAVAGLEEDTPLVGSERSLSAQLLQLMDVQELVQPVLSDTETHIMELQVL
jgi:hypothetical protein